MGWLRSLGSAAALALPALLAACATLPDNRVVPGHEGAPGVRTFLACAPNTALALAPELDGGTVPLRETIDAYLKSHGRAVEWIDLYEGRSLWKQALARAKEAGEIARTPALFAEALGERFEFEAIVMPSILLHTTRANSNNGRWDGVHRRVRIVNMPDRGPARSKNTLAEGIAWGGISGDMAVTSIHLMVFARGGERVFEGRGGLEFVQDIDMAPVLKEYRYEMPLRSDLFQDPGVLREGVEIAFTPYLSPVEEP